jgi:hypothetical protein
VDDFDISIYTSEELERLESLRDNNVNLLKKGEMDVDLPSLFRIVGWCFVMRFLESLLLVEGIQRIEHIMEG